MHTATKKQKGQEWSSNSEDRGKCVQRDRKERVRKGLGTKEERRTQAQAERIDYGLGMTIREWNMQKLGFLVNHVLQHNLLDLNQWYVFCTPRHPSNVLERWSRPLHMCLQSSLRETEEDKTQYAELLALIIYHMIAKCINVVDKMQDEIWVPVPLKRGDVLYKIKCTYSMVMDCNKTKVYV